MCQLTTGLANNEGRKGLRLMPQYDWHTRQGEENQEKQDMPDLWRQEASILHVWSFLRLQYTSSFNVARRSSPADFVLALTQSSCLPPYHATTPHTDCSYLELCFQLG
jgi:hypothetical protein